MTLQASTLQPSPVHDRVKFGDRISIALADILAGLFRARLWSMLGWEEIKATYKRSIFGFLWITLSFAAFIVVKLVIFKPLMANISTSYYTLYLTAGYFSWAVIASVVNGAPNVFSSAEGYIKNDPLPFSIYVFRMLYRVFFNALLMSVVVVGVFLFLEVELTPVALMAIPAVLVYVFTSFWVILLFGTICTRFRDVSHFIHTIMRMAFFLTPIIWLPEQLGGLMKYLWWNPFYHYIWILRAPLIDAEPAIESWIFVGVTTVIGSTLALLVFARFRHRIVFWF